MAMNGHFASVGQNGQNGSFENGIQVIDEDKEFKYVCRSRRLEGGIFVTDSC